MQRQAPEIIPVVAEVFAGKLDPNTLPMPRLVRQVMGLAHTRTGDWRNWQAICDWAANLRSALNDTVTATNPHNL